MVGKYLEVFYLGVGESAGLLRTNWEMSLIYSTKDNLWSIYKIVDGESVAFSADQSAILEVHIVRADVQAAQQFCKLSLRIKRKFWSTLLLLFYLEGIYVPAKQQQAHLCQLNYYVSLCFTQMCLCHSCILCVQS